MTREQFGRPARRERREQARELAKEILNRRVSPSDISVGDIVLFCLSVVVGIAISLMDRSPTNVLIALFSMVIFLVRPVLRLKWVRNATGKRKVWRGTAAIAGCILVVGLFGYFEWPQPASLEYMVSWGIWGSPSGNGPPIPAERVEALRVVVQGLLLQQFKSSCKIAGVAFHYSGTTDIDDAQALQKSGLYDIYKGPITIRIPLDEQFRKSLIVGTWGTNYSLLLVPNGISIDRFATLREAKKLGIRILQLNSGPP